MANLSAFFNEYGKYYIVNDTNGHTEYIQLWYIEYDENEKQLFLKINRDISNKICYDHMYSKCHYCPLSFCPWIHVDKRLVAMNDSCSCRTNGNSNNNTINNAALYNNNRCRKYHLKSHHLRVCNKQKYGPLSRSLKEIKKYIESVKLMKIKDEEYTKKKQQEQQHNYNNYNYNNFKILLIIICIL